MSDITEAFGTAAEGGLFARVFRGSSGSLTDKAGNPVEKGHFKEGACLNCGTDLVGEHCHACGQKAHLHRTIGAFLHDLLHGALHLDGKIWRTLPMLIRKPGELTRRYIDGERSKFVSPMALFLFSVFLMFAVFQAVGLTAPTDMGGADTLSANVEKVHEDVEAKVVEQRQRVADMSPDSPQYADATARLKRYEDQLVALNTVETLDFGGNDSASFKGTGIKAIDEGLIKKWRENPGLMLYKLQANAYKFSWLLIPISIPFVWIMFAWKRRFRAYDHAIFATYSIAFMSLLFITLSLLAAGGIGGAWVFLALAVIPPVHIYKHLKYTYGLSRFSAIWRLFMLLGFVVVILLLFFQVLLLLGAA
ncbi:MAG: DUF3667 domain-containing protein [Sphingomonadales bacterium]|nr:MAG: DUF3667 domain-containing protein [Sphingomonadales bacterium]